MTYGFGSCITDGLFMLCAHVRVPWQVKFTGEAADRYFRRLVSGCVVVIEDCIVEKAEEQYNPTHFVTAVQLHVKEPQGAPTDTPSRVIVQPEALYPELRTWALGLLLPTASFGLMKRNCLYLVAGVVPEAAEKKGG